MTLIDHLIQNSMINKGALPDINSRIKKESLEKVVSEYGVTPDELLKAKSEYYGVPYKEVESTVPFEIIQSIPEESALHYQFVAIGEEDGFLEIGMIDPSNIEARDALNFISSKIEKPYKVFIVSEKDFKRVIDMYKGLSGQVSRAVQELETDLSEDEKEISKQIKDAVQETGETIIEDAPVTKMVATILRYAVDGNASDIHIEPLREQIRVRFRVDGVLTTSLMLPSKVHSAIVARIKVLSSMKLDEKRKPQDGRFSANMNNRKIDFRVSTFPSYYGEKVVMRILDQDKGIKKLEELGLQERELGLLKKAMEAPYGLVLISGPTGSGKTTTLYSILQEIDKDSYNVLSLEDPIEYSINGVNQSQVHAEIGYTFATGLRTTLRQDPDIILVGEIRDAETAKLAIQAALTGHLVFSTIHTNNAIGIVPRLIDMGVDPYLIAPTLILGIAQRLVRKICVDTGKKLPFEGSIAQMVEKQFADLPEQYRSRIPKADHVLELEATSQCPSGVKGREAVFEMFEVDRDMEKTILTKPSEQGIYEVARKQGMFTMREDAIIKALNHRIPMEEVYKL